MKMLIGLACFLSLLLPPTLAEARPQQQTVGQPSAVAPLPAAGGAASASPDYLLGSGDKIRIEVYKEPQLSQSLQVRPDGKITMPLIGDLTAAGLTPSQLRDRVGTALTEYLRITPSVTVMVVEAVASAVYIMGEVNKPGTIQMTGPMTVLQALAMAGGFRDFAKTGKIRILRNGPHGVETLRFNYDGAVKGSAENFLLQRGDTIIVP